jgi:NADPH:quinone reductase-like Zn-dependent oxidoreductase
MKAARFSRFGGPEVLEIVDRIAVRAAGVNTSDWNKRMGLMDPELSQTLGYEAAGIVNEVGDGAARPANHDYLRSLGARRCRQRRAARVHRMTTPQR